MLSLSLYTSLLFGVASATPLSLHEDASSASPNIRTIFSFDNGTFLENIAVRPNGNLIVDTLSHPWVYTIDPTKPYAQPSILTVFNDGIVNGVSGIAELYPDHFAIVAANWTLAQATGTNFSIWTFDAGASPVVPRKAAVLPPNGLGNGATPLPGLPGVLLTADSYLGGVWRVNTVTGAVKLIIQDETMLPSADSAAATIGLGINGLHIRGRYLYYYNSSRDFFARIPIHPDGTRAGPAEIIASAPMGQTGDDFTFDRAGNAWVASHPNALLKITPAGKLTIAAGGGNSTVLGRVGPTSCAFGRGGKAQQSILYITLGDGAVKAIDVSELSQW